MGLETLYRRYFVDSLQRDSIPCVVFAGDSKALFAVKQALQRAGNGSSREPRLFGPFSGRGDSRISERFRVVTQISDLGQFQSDLDFGECPDIALTVRLV